MLSSPSPVIRPWYTEGMDEPDDTRAILEADADRLLDAARVLMVRFRTGKHDGTAEILRKAAAELMSRARHPSRSWIDRRSNGDEPAAESSG